MNILVTGGNGQLGLSIKKISGQYPAHNFFFADLPDADITHEENITELVKKNEIDIIVNCAAYTAVDKAESEPEAARNINVIGPRVLARICKKYDLKLVHISTDYVFDGESNVPLLETNSCDNPIGVYGQTKKDAEDMIAESEVDSVIIRTAWLYSEFGNNFVKTMLRLAENRNELGVIFDQIGTPTYAPDLAVAIAEIINKGIEKGCNIYHYSNEGVCSWYDFAKEIFGQSGIDMKVNPLHTYEYQTPAKRPKYSVLDKSKIKSEGIHVPYWKDSLKTCLEELKKQ